MIEKEKVLYSGYLGYAYLKLGQTPKAKEYYNKAITILEEIGSPHTDYYRNQLEQIEHEIVIIQGNAEEVTELAKAAIETKEIYCLTVQSVGVEVYMVLLK